MVFYILDLNKEKNKGKSRFINMTMTLMRSNIISYQLTVINNHSLRVDKIQFKIKFKYNLKRVNLKT